MNKAFAWVFLLGSAVFFVFVVGLTGYRLDEARRVNAAAARERMPVLVQRVASLRDSLGGLTTPLFKKEMRAAFDAEPRLLLLAIHSQDGMLYLVTRNRAFLREPADVTPEWRGTPSYVVSQGYEILLSAPIDGSTGAPTVDALSVIMGREDLYPVVRDDLYLFLAFLFVCGVLMLIVISVQQETVPGRAPANGVVVPHAPPPAEPRSGDQLPPRAWESQAPAAGPAAAPGPVATPGPAAAGLVAAAAPSPHRGLTSPGTGLVWADHLETRLKAELVRAAAADQDLACARVRIDGPFVGGALPTAYVEIARALKAAVPVQDLIFESGEDSYAVILPDMGVDAAVHLMEELRAKVSASIIEGRTRSLSIGVSARGGRLIEHTIILEEAETALAKAGREGGNQVIGFRADASRFREILAGSAAER